MRKCLSLALVLVLCLLLCGCGKSEAVKNVEAMIDALGEITPESIAAITEAESAYAALSAEEQAKVESHPTLTAARDRYWELMLPGQWCYGAPTFGTALYNLGKVEFILHPDLTWESNVCGPDTGTWSVRYGVLELTDPDLGYIYNTLNIVESDGFLGLGHQDTITHIRKEEQIDFLSDTFLILDLAEIDPNDYFGFRIYERHTIDEWGEPTGTGYTSILLQNKLYDEGWLYLGTVGDFAIEVLIPEYTVTYTNSSGYSSTSTHEATNDTISYNPFSSGIHYLYGFGEDYKETSDLSADDLAFGRAKGIIVFVRSEYVTVQKDEQGTDQRVLARENAECPMSQYVGDWLDDVNY